MQYTDFLLLHIHATYKISNFTHKVFMYINILFFLLFMGGGVLSTSACGRRYASYFPAVPLTSSSMLSSCTTFSCLSCIITWNSRTCTSGLLCMAAVEKTFTATSCPFLCNTAVSLVQIMYKCTVKINLLKVSINETSNFPIVFPQQLHF